MPRKTAAKAGAASASTRTSTRVRKSPEVLATTQSTATEPRANKRKVEEADDELKGKKARATAPTAPKSIKQTKSIPKTKNLAAKSRVAATQTDGKKTKASTAETKPTKRKASDDEDDIEAPQPKKSKTTTTTARPIEKATTTKKASRQAAAPEPAAKSTIVRQIFALHNSPDYPLTKFVR
jgi:regulator of chromosome condensation